MKNNKVDTWRAGAKRLSIFSPNLVHHHDENDSTTKTNNDGSSLPHVKIVEPHQHQSAADVSLYSSSSNASIGSLGSRVRVHQTERVEQVEKTPTKKENILDHLLHFWRKFSVICLSPIFLRHRNIFIVAFEVFVPAFVAFVIFAAFTSGISWKMVNANKHSKERNSLEVPDLTMEAAMEKFREVHTDSFHHVLMFYTPITPYTTLVMKQAIKLLKLAENNRVETHKHHTVGILGAESEIEMIERALLHRKEKMGHGVPIGVRFEYNETDIEPDLGVPYDLKYAIYSFNESIHQTADNYPFVAPPESKSYLSPYVASGFLGLQYAIDRAVIDIVILKQMPEEDVDGKKTEEQQFKETIQKLFHLQLMRQFSTSTETEILGNMTMSSTYSSDTTNPTTAEPTITGPPTTEPTRYTYTSTNGDSSTTDYPTTTEDPATMDDPSTRTNTTTELNNKNYLRRITRPSDLPTIKLKMFTFANFRSEHFRNLVAFVVTYALVVAYSFMAFFIVRQIVQENISGIKDLLQMHGMPHYIHWFCLFFHALFFRAITSALVVAALKISFGHGAIIEATSASVLFTFVLVHQVALSFMNFFIATCIRSTQMCGVVAIFCGVLSFYIPETFDGMKLIGIYTNYGLAAIFPNWTLRHVLRTLIDFESDEKGITWNNIMDTNHSSNKVSVGMGIFILTGTGVVYFFMAAYHDMTGASMLFPPTRKWYDFKERSRQRKETKLHQEELHKDIAEGRTTNFEKPAVYQEPEKDRKCFVHVRHVSKRYGKHKVALDSVSMNIMHEEITVILGHTNSGKSTLMAILSGMMMPSSGYAIVKGYDVNFEAKEARKYVGLCTQQMVAFNLLTVREHITLCYRLRGYSKKDCDRHGATLLQRLRLWHIRSFLPDRLKVDEMRRLGIALAMADAPKVLLLDEPTGGMDPTGRREVWDILLTLKNHHTIILTTNLIDEADYLADRVALLAHGRLICYGSLDYLKQNYDTGYFLKIIPSPGVVRLDTNAIIKIIQDHMGPDIPIPVRRHTRMKDVDVLELELPANQNVKFPAMCEELEQNKANLCIDRYSMRQVSLSDIFIRICSSVAAQGSAVDLYVRRDSVGELRSALRSEIPEPPEKTALINSKTHQIFTLLKKRWTVMKAVFHSFLFYFIIPLLLIWIVVFQAKLFILPHQTNPSRTLTARAFDANIGHDHADLVMYYRTAYADNSIQYTDLIEDILNPYGIKLGVYERVSTKLYEDIFVPPGAVGYAKEIRMAAFELIRPEVMKSEFDIDFIGYFSSGALHSAPIVLNIINNVLLRVAYDNPNGRIMSLTTVNDPLPQVKPPKFGVECGVTCTVLAVMMSFAIAFLSHSCIILPMWERQNGMKHLQLMCGVHPVTYWVSNFIYDAFFMFSVVVIIVMIFNADYYQTFSSAELVGAIWIICTIYLVWSGMMFAYFMSVLIPIKYNGYNFLAGLHLFVGIIPILFLSNDGAAAVFFRNVFVLFLPPFTITSAFRNYFDIASKRDTCRGINDYIKKVCNVKSATSHEHFIHKGHYTSETEQFAKVSMQDVDLAMCCDRICLPVKSCYKPPAAFNTSAETWDSTGLITDTISLFFQGFIYLGLLIMVERGVIEKYMQRIYSRFMNYREQGFKMARKSHDIYQESLAVQSKVKGAKKNVVSNNEVDLICLNLNKSTSTRILIQDFNLEAKSGQCIAILGGGGSGKTCIAKMIAGEMMPTRGNCYIHKKNLFHKRKDYLAYIGYCPQKTSLYTDFTGSQMCKLMGRLRGVPGHLLDTHAAKWLNVFGLEEVAHDKCKYYAQGMRQRLGAAMALIGGPSIILLDEPTTDVDPFARERFWSVIEHIQREGHTIILTTYSTEEAFSLADKVVVIAAGNMQCVGSPENLQTKYGKGHTILFKLKHELILSSGAVMVMMPTIEEFKKKVQESFEHIDLLDEHDDLMMYFLRDARLSWAFVFRSMHALAVEYNSVIESFDVSESEIEDIFIFMTNKHHELDKPRRSEPQMLLQTRLKDGEGSGDGKQKQVRRSMNTKKRLTNIV